MTGSRDPAIATMAVCRTLESALRMEVNRSLFADSKVRDTHVACVDEARAVYSSLMPVFNGGRWLMTLDLETSAFLSKVAAAASKPRHLMTPGEARTAFARIGTILSSRTGLPDGVPLTIPVQDGEIRARLYVPNDRPGALLIYFHGGGWVVG